MSVVRADPSAQDSSQYMFLQIHIPPTSCPSPFLQVAAAQLLQTYISAILENDNGLGCETMHFAPCGNFHLNPFVDPT